MPEDDTAGPVVPVTGTAGPRVIDVTVGHT
jgi:hypothetical protein